MAKTEKPSIAVINHLVTKYQISKTVLAKLMGMPRGTFNNKISESLPQYRFSDDELIKLRSAIRDMALDIIETLDSPPPKRRR